jgi:hypothetical protein
MGIVMPAWASATVIAIVGVSTLTGLTLTPGPSARRVAVLVPPWAEVALPEGARVLDLRWQGHLMILDTGAAPSVLAGLRAAGGWVLDAGGFALCGETERAGNDFDS